MVCAAFFWFRRNTSYARRTFDRYYWGQFDLYELNCPQVNGMRNGIRMHRFCRRRRRCYIYLAHWVNMLCNYTYNAVVLNIGFAEKDQYSIVNSFVLSVSAYTVVILWCIVFCVGEARSFEENPPFFDGTTTLHISAFIYFRIVIFSIVILRGNFSFVVRILWVWHQSYERKKCWCLPKRFPNKIEMKGHMAYIICFNIELLSPYPSLFH